MLLLNNGSGNLSQELLGAQSGDGFADLQALDSNGDGVINALDPAFSSLEVWVDQTADGQGEIETLSQLGITSISLATTPVGGNINGNIVVSGSTFSSGADGATLDSISEVNFQTATIHQRYVPPAGFSYSPEALLLPQLEGYGNLSDLQVAMTQNTSLLDSVQSLVLSASAMSGAELDAAFQDVMLEWAGVSDVAAGTYGPNVNAQHLAFIGAFYGADFALQGDPTVHAGLQLEADYRSLIDQLELRFASQVAASETALGVTPSSADPFAAFTVVSWDPASDMIAADLGSLIWSIVQGAPSDESDAESYYSLAIAAARGLNETNFGGDTTSFAIAVLSDLGVLGVDADLQQSAVGAIGFTSVLDETNETGTVALNSVNGVVFLGTGDKAISGGSGDIYVYNSAGGNDTIDDEHADAQLVLGGVASNEVAIERSNGGNDLVIVNSATGSTLTLTGYFSSGANFGNPPPWPAARAPVAGTQPMPTAATKAVNVR
jgi:hypothetical protein